MTSKICKWGHVTLFPNTSIDFLALWLATTYSNHHYYWVAGLRFNQWLAFDISFSILLTPWIEFINPADTTKFLCFNPPPTQQHMISLKTSPFSHIVKNSFLTVLTVAWASLISFRTFRQKLVWHKESNDIKRRARKCVVFQQANWHTVRCTECFQSSKVNRPPKAIVHTRRVI